MLCITRMNKILQFYSLINKHFIAGRLPIVRVFPITDMAPKVHPKFSMNPQAPIKPEKKTIQRQSKPAETFRVSS